MLALTFNAPVSAITYMPCMDMRIHSTGLTMPPPRQRDAKHQISVFCSSSVSKQLQPPRRPGLMLWQTRTSSWAATSLLSAHTQHISSVSHPPSACLPAKRQHIVSSSAAQTQARIFVSSHIDLYSNSVIQTPCRCNAQHALLAIPIPAISTLPYLP